MNAELINALRYCGKNQGCYGCPLWSKPSSACFKIMLDAADALEAADKSIAELRSKTPVGVAEAMAEQWGTLGGEHDE